VVRCTVPKLAGKTLVQARAVIGRARCSVGRISRKPSIRVLRGRVSTQSPAAGATLRRGSKVNLTLSTGKSR
jgi:serine/threonine-protein kinase